MRRVGAVICFLLSCLVPVAAQAVGVGLLAMLLLGSPVCSAREKVPTATVSILLTDGEGNGLPNLRIASFQNTKTNAQLSSRFGADDSSCFGARAVKEVPYGTYQLEASAGNFPPVHMTVRVGESRVCLGISARTATVHVLESNGAGQLFDIAKVKALDDSYGDLADHFEKGLGKNIPYGTYRMTVDHFFSESTQIVDVYSPDVWVLAGPSQYENLADSRAVGPLAQTPATGVIKNVPRAVRPLLVKMVGLFSNYTAATKVEISGDSGTFSFRTSEPYGKYLLLVLSHDRELARTEVSLPVWPDGPIQIEIVDSQTVAPAPEATSSPVHIDGIAYPKLGIQVRAEGEVTLAAMVGADGNVGDVHVEAIRGTPAAPVLAGPAAENLRKWRFQPGEPKIFRITYQFQFVDPASPNPQPEWKLVAPDRMLITTNRQVQACEYTSRTRKK